MGSGIFLFVAGEPDDAPRPFKDVQSPYVRLFMGAGMPGWKQKRDQSGEAGSLPGLIPAEGAKSRMRIPPDQIGCMRDVARIAIAEGLIVTVVDVNQSSSDRGLVERWVGPNDVLPLLVRSDGQKLVGAGEFVPRRIRQFIRGK